MTKSSCRIPLVVAVATAVMALNATPIRFGTWNIRLSSMDKWEKYPRFPKWEARMPRVMGLIEEKGFDLMGLQEVGGPQTEFIRKAMPDWGLVGTVTNDAERSRTSHANGIFYRKDRFRFFNTHFDHRSQLVREKGMELILARRFSSRDSSSRKDTVGRAD